jgi:four helix bundle protein
LYDKPGGSESRARLSDDRHVQRDFDDVSAPEYESFPACTISESASSGSSRASSRADVYTLCRGRPREELVVTSQLRRAALAVAANIAEGCGKSSRPEVIRYLDIAAGSAAETEHHLVTWQDIGGIDGRHCARLLAREASIRRMLYALMRNLPE